jgi:hypothetical protein
MMGTRGRWVAPAALLAAVTLAAAGCGGDDESSGGETTAAAETTEPATTEEATTTEVTTGATTEETTEAATGVADEDCVELASVGAKFSEALGATGQNADYEATTRFFDELVEKAPDEIRDDLATVAAAWREIASELNDLNLQGGQAPSPETIAKLQQLSAKFDTPKLNQASKNLQAWANEHCGTGTTP